MNVTYALKIKIISLSENNITTSKKFVVMEETEPSNHEDIEIRNKENISENEESVQDQADKGLKTFENNIPIPNITVVREVTGHSNQEDVENRNNGTVSSDEECVNEQVDNEPGEMKKSEYRNGLYGFVIIATCVSWTSPITMIPVHNVFKTPEFWWESRILHGTFFVILVVALPITQEIYLVFKEEFLNSNLYRLLYFTAFYLGSNTTYVFIYIVWTMYMGYNFPMPNYSIPCGYIGLFCLMVAIWFGFPKGQRNRPEFKKRLKTYLCYCLIVTTVNIQQVLLDGIFSQLTTYEYENGTQVQWVIAIIIPIFRGFAEWLLPKVFMKAAGHENDDARFSLESWIGITYGLYVTVRLAASEESTENWTLGIEMSINFYYALRIIWLHIKVQGDLSAEEIIKWANEKQYILKNLVTMEAIEILIPFAYSMTYAMAYFGPNAKLMGGVRNNYWHNTEQDIEEQLSVLLKMGVLDACGAIIIGFLLGLICKINIFKEYCYMMKQHWITLSVYIGGNFVNVRNISRNTK